MGNLCNLDGRRKDKEMRLANQKKKKQMSPLNLNNTQPNSDELRYELNKVLLIQKMFKRLLRPRRRKQLDKELNSLLISSGVRYLTLPDFEEFIPSSYKEKYETLPKNIPEEIYLKYHQNDDKFMKFPLQYPDETIYFGEMTANGFRQGYGVYIDQFKHAYEGYWFNNSIVYGREYYLNGTIYEGKFVNFMPNDDYAKIVYNDGDFYSGPVRDNKKNGHGQLVFNDGTMYVGDFVNDQFHGKGRITWPDNSIFEGDLDNGAISGHGRFTTTEGNVYDGEWRGNQRHGNGRFNWASGASYVGEYVRGRKEGKGVYIDKNIRYEGEWKNDKPHGRGTLIVDGKERTGSFRYGKMYTLDNEGDSSEGVFTNILIERENVKDTRSLAHLANLSEYSEYARSESQISYNDNNERNSIQNILKSEIVVDNQPIISKLAKENGSEKEYNLLKEKGYEREAESDEKGGFMIQPSEDYKELIENVNNFNERAVEMNKEVIIYKESSHIQTTGIRTDEVEDNPIVITSVKEEMANPFKISTPQKTVNSKENYVQKVNFN
jgi:hypothetical protein